MHNIVYIHGAFSSGLSFQRIQEKLPKHNQFVPEYTVDNDLGTVIKFVDEMVKDIKEPVDIIAHSLGGIVAAHVAILNPHVRSLLTMSTPFGGSKIADLLRWFSSHQLYQSLNAQNPLLTKIHKTPLHCKHRAVITTVGQNPMMFEPNDGVVSLKSQLAVPNAEQIKVDLNHFEVLLSDTTVKLIKEFTFK